jgi:hypothetical protein
MGQGVRALNAPPPPPPQPVRFVARCTACGFTASAVRYGMEREHLAAHFAAVHLRTCPLSLPAPVEE